MCRHLQKSVETRFPTSQASAVGGFLFLRLICPALVSPISFGILKKPPTNESGRALILVAKILQNIANDVEFGDKESYLMEMNELIKSRQPQVKEFLISVARPVSNQESLVITSNIDISIEKANSSLTNLQQYLQISMPKIQAAIEKAKQKRLVEEQEYKFYRMSVIQQRSPSSKTKKSTSDEMYNSIARRTKSNLDNDKLDGKDLISSPSIQSESGIGLIKQLSEKKGGTMTRDKRAKSKENIKSVSDQLQSISTKRT